MELLQAIVGILWSEVTFAILLVAGVLFTVWTKFIQYTAMTHGIQVVRGIYDNPDDPGAINHFQALSAALSATVGLGNIGGVALAIGIGGPGALFWMWIVGVFGMALKTTEITLAMMYRNTDDPENPHGGAMWVVEKVIGGKGGFWKPVARAIGVFFCITLLVSTFTGGNMFQSWNVAELTESYFHIPRLFTGVVMAVIVGLVIVGGIKRIGLVAARVVPLMCLLYIIASIVVLAMNVVEIPGLLALVVRCAFDKTEAAGAFVGGGMGFAFSIGLQRALFSNEAGQGSAPIAHAAAKTGEPAREGIVGGIGPFVDTLCICTLTALVILSTDTWNRDAIGTFRSSVELMRDSKANPPTWNVNASTDAGHLPESKYGEWNVGASFYLIARVAGATNGQTRENLVKITGKVDQVGNEWQGDTPLPRLLKWNEVKIDPATWEGTPTEIALVTQEVFREYAGAQLTGHAFDRQFLGLGKWLVTSAAWLFAISTMISWSYYGEQGMVYMLGNASVLPYKILYLAGTVYAAVGIQNVEHMGLLIDLGTGAMLWSNLPIVLILGFLAVGCLNQYKRQLAAGEFKTHTSPPITDVVDGTDVK